MLDISAESRDPDVVALETAYEMLVIYESKRSSVSFGMVGGRSWSGKLTWRSLVEVVVALAVPTLWPPASPADRRRFLRDSWTVR